MTDLAVNTGTPSRPETPLRRRGRGLLAGLALLASGAALAAPAACPALLDRKLPRLQDEQPQDLCRYAGKVLLVVNTASRCGYTPQFEQLEALQQRYASRGLVVIGVPSHDFRQELASREAIASFCQSTYGVRFPMLGPLSVRGTQADPFYQELARRGGGAPSWNFHKYLIARDGSTVQGVSTRVEPMDPGFVTQLEKLLDAKRD